MARQRTWTVTCFETRVYKVDIEVTAKNAEQAEARVLSGEGIEVGEEHTNTTDRDTYDVKREAA